MKQFVKNISRLFRPADNVKVTVLGHQKTGTTAIAALLARIADYGMSNDPLYEIDQGKGIIAKELLSNPQSFKKIVRRYPGLFGKEVIKDPDLIFIYPVLRECFKNTQYLFVIRDPRDTIRSICNRLKLEGTYSKNRITKADMYEGNYHWELILSNHLPKISHITDAQNFIINLAQRWKLAAEIYMHNSSEMQMVKYEDFLLDKENTIKNLAHKLNLPCLSTISEFLDVQYQPKGNASVQWDKFFGENNLLAIETICNKTMSEFGYRSTL